MMNFNPVFTFTNNADIGLKTPEYAQSLPLLRGKKRARHTDGENRREE